MARLQCDARNCVHNKEHFCCISSICVDGKQAMRDAETCCADFQRKKRSCFQQCMWMRGEKSRSGYSL